MLNRVGFFFAETLKRWIPDPFVFALLITLFSAVMAMTIVDAGPMQIIDAWYQGFWILLEFAMQMILILATGYCIALSPPVNKLIDKLAHYANTPSKVYGGTILIGGIFVLVSWSWVVLTAVFAREVANRVRGIDYAYLTACVYLSFGVWVAGLSSSIPLLLNTDNNFLIKEGLLDSTIAIGHTLGSTMNLLFMFSIILGLMALMIWMRPKEDLIVEMDALEDKGNKPTTLSIAEEAESLKLPTGNFSDAVNNSVILQGIICLLGFWFGVRYFLENGFDINLNIIIFLFLFIGMLFHRTPMRYVLAMRRACSNVSGVIFQFPFYAGIMGIMMYTGLAKELSLWMTESASVATLPAYAYISGALVNFAIPSAGGEWAVIGPSFIESAKVLGEGMDAEGLDAFLSRVALSVAYGESATNLLQPFFLLLILPVMGAGVRIQARDVMGHLVIPCIITITFGLILVTSLPL